MKIEMIGSTKYKGKQYTVPDCTKMVTPESMGLHNFYGGRVKRLGKLDIDGLFLCIEGINGIDLVLFEDLEIIPEKEFIFNDKPDSVIFGASDVMVEDAYDMPVKAAYSPPTEEKVKEPTKDIKAKSLPRKKK